MWDLCWCFLQAEDGMRDLVRSRGLGDVYKRQSPHLLAPSISARVYVDGADKDDLYPPEMAERLEKALTDAGVDHRCEIYSCLLYTSDAADERSSVDLGGRRIIKKKKEIENSRRLSE